MLDNHTHRAETAPLRVAVIVGSTRVGRRGRLVADWYLRRLADDTDFETGVIDLVDYDLPLRYRVDGNETVDSLLKRLDRADAFVVVTPEYNHSFPASLKNAIDYGRSQWYRKPVAFVSYGGVSGGLRAVEHLRQVFAELHAVGIRDSVSFHGPFNGFGDDGPGDPASAARAVEVQLEDLRWWARILRDGRNRTLVETR